MEDSSNGSPIARARSIESGIAIEQQANDVNDSIIKMANARLMLSCRAFGGDGGEGLSSIIRYVVLFPDRATRACLPSKAILESEFAPSRAVLMMWYTCACTGAEFLIWGTYLYIKDTRNTSDSLSCLSWDRSGTGHRGFLRRRLTADGLASRCRSHPQPRAPQWAQPGSGQCAVFTRCRVRTGLCAWALRARVLTRRSRRRPRARSLRWWRWSGWSGWRWWRRWWGR